MLGHAAIGKNNQFVVRRHGVDEGRVKLAQRWSRPSMITSNPPDPHPPAGRGKRAFIPPSMEALRPRVAQIVDERFDHLAALGEADVMAELAFPLPVTVIGELIGVPEEDRAWFRPLMNTLVTSDFQKAGPDSLKEIEKAGDDFEAYFVELTNVIGNGLLALFENPGEMDRLWADGGLVPSLVEEVLRFDTPVPLIHRQVLEDVEVCGQTLRAGDVVMTFLGAANRDPARFPDPDAFDIGRPDNLHLSFAWGLHFCLGARLARMEGQLVFAGLRRRFSRVEPAGEWRRRPGLDFRALDSLPVRVTQR